MERGNRTVVDKKQSITDDLGVYVGNLCNEMSEEKIRNLFVNFKGTEFVRLIKKNNRTFCFLLCDTVQEVIRLVTSMNQKVVNGRPIVVRALNDELQQVCSQKEFVTEKECSYDAENPDVMLGACGTDSSLMNLYSCERDEVQHSNRVNVTDIPCPKPSMMNAPVRSGLPPLKCLPHTAAPAAHFIPQPRASHCLGKKQYHEHPRDGSQQQVDYSSMPKLIPISPPVEPDKFRNCFTEPPQHPISNYKHVPGRQIMPPSYSATYFNSHPDKQYTETSLSYNYNTSHNSSQHGTVSTSRYPMPANREYSDRSRASSLSGEFIQEFSEPELHSFGHVEDEDVLSQEELESLLEHLYKPELVSVSNFPFHTTVDEIFALFEDFDPVQVWMLSNTYRRYGCTEAYVLFANEKLALDAILNFDNTQFKRRTLLVTDMQEDGILEDLLVLHGLKDPN